MNIPEPIVCYTVHRTVDEYGRLGGLVAVKRTEHEANECAKGQGWYGGTGAVKKTYAIPVDDSRVLLLASPDAVELDVNLIELRKQKKEAARAKLTDEEAALLGIKD